MSHPVPQRCHRSSKVVSCKCGYRFAVTALICAFVLSIMLNAGSRDYPAEISQEYKGTGSSKMGGFPSQSSIVSDDSTFGSQEPHVTFSARQRGHKKIT